MSQMFCGADVRPDIYAPDGAHNFFSCDRTDQDQMSVHRLSMAYLQAKNVTGTPRGVHCPIRPLAR